MNIAAIANRMAAVPASQLDEQDQRAGVEPFARHVDLEHARRRPAPSSVARSAPEPIAGWNPNRSRTAARRARAAPGRKSASIGLPTSQALRFGGRDLGRRERDAGADARHQIELVPSLIERPVGVVGVARHQLDRGRDFARDRGGEAAGDDVEMAAVEHLKGDGDGDGERDQDDQQGPPEQRPGQHFLDQAGLAGKGDVDHQR